MNKTIEIDDDVKLRTFYDKRVAEEFDGEGLGEEFKGYVFRIAGGQDKQGFPMKQGVLTNTRVRLLLKRGTVGFQAWRGRKGERRRKSVHGCIASPALSIIHLTIVKKGEQEIPGVTDNVAPRILVPKRAGKIRKLFNLSKEDDVRKYVIKHEKKVGKKGTIMVAPKIQRLVTPERIRRKKQMLKKSKMKKVLRKENLAAYKALLEKRKQEKKEAAKQ